MVLLERLNLALPAHLGTHRSNTMTICTIFDDLGQPPENCAALQQWLWLFVQRLTTVNPIKCGTDTDDPVSDDLEALWGDCDIPPGALVIWYNSVSGNTTYWVCPEGSINGCNWTEYTLS